MILTQISIRTLKLSLSGDEKFSKSSDLPLIPSLEYLSLKGYNHDIHRRILHLNTKYNKLTLKYNGIIEKIIKELKNTEINVISL
jgi:hypothetical protein